MGTGGAGEMPQLSIALAALEVDPDWVLGTHIRQPTNAYNYSYKGPDTLFWPLWSLVPMYSEII